MMRRSLVVVCALALSACGQTSLSSSETTGAPSAPLPLEGTCTAPVPGGFVVEPRNGNAYLSWSAVASGVYEIEIYEVVSGALVASQITDATTLEWDAHDLGQGPYRARVRSITDCGKSAWSAFDEFILNRSSQPPVPAPPVPTPPGPTPPGPPPGPALQSCGTLQGEYVVDLLDKKFHRGSWTPIYAPLSLPAGTYRVQVETNDNGHRAGFQTNQTQEVVTVWGVGTTWDIPDAATRQVTTFTATLPMLQQIVVEGGPDMVDDGVCVAFSAL